MSKQNMFVVPDIYPGMFPLSYPITITFTQTLKTPLFVFIQNTFIHFICKLLFYFLISSLNKNMLEYVHVPQTMSSTFRIWYWSLGPITNQQ